MHNPSLSTGPHTSRGSLTAWSPAVRLSLAFLGFLLLGLVLSFVGAQFLDRLGHPASFVLILAGPPLVFLFVAGARQGLAEVPAFWRKLTWWHGLWFLLLASSFVFRTRDVESVQSNPLDTAAIFRVCLVGTTALILIVRLTLRRPPWLGSLFSGLVGVMALFALVCTLTSLWSVNRPWTLYKSLEYLGDVSLLAVILVMVQSTEAYESLMDWTWTLFGSIVFLAWAEAAIWPAEALEAERTGGMLKYRLNCLYPGYGTNSVGTFGAIIAAVAICRLLPTAGRKFNRTWYVVLLIMGVVTMVFSQTRSAMAGFLVGVLLMLVFTGRKLLIAGLGIASVAALALTGAGKLFVEFLERGQSQAEIMSLSSRTIWWTVAWNAFKQHPFTGLGAFAAGQFAIFPKMGLKEVTPLHSDYVEALVGSGIWGPVLLILGLLWTWWVLIQFLRRFPSMSLERQLAVEAIAVLSILTVRSAFMNLIVFHPAFHYFAILGYAEFLRRRFFKGSPANPSTAGNDRIS
jgi:hypothetical protein